MRSRGITAMDALEFMRMRIERLPNEERADVVKQIRNFEIERATQPNTNSQVKPLTPLRRASNGDRVAEAEPEVQVACPNCGKHNPSNEVFCYSCGFVLIKEGVATETRRLQETGMQSSEIFDSQATLVLVLRQNKQQFRLRPQDSDHEMILGRADQAFMPDINLNREPGNLSVSRMHMCIRFNADTNTLTATDLNSANGTYVNGQRLYPKEVRTLRHGDELRLGQMVFNVYYQR